MRRRDFITLLGSATAWPLATRAQQAKAPVVGWLALASARLRPSSPAVSSFVQGLAESGYVVDQNVSIDFEFVNRLSLLSHRASELASREVDVIVATGSPGSALAAKAATPTIPIVFVAPMILGRTALLAILGGPKA